jgi:hypothetical protein
VQSKNHRTSPPVGWELGLRGSVNLVHSDVGLTLDTEQVPTAAIAIFTRRWPVAMKPPLNPSKFFQMFAISID